MYTFYQQPGSPDVVRAIEFDPQNEGEQYYAAIAQRINNYEVMRVAIASDHPVMIVEIPRSFPIKHEVLAKDVFMKSHVQVQDPGTWLSGGSPC